MFLNCEIRVGMATETRPDLGGSSAKWTVVPIPTLSFAYDSTDFIVIDVI